MDKKQFTSWGVSFGSLALVAGMVSYLGLTTPAKTGKNQMSVQTPVSGQNSNQPQGGNKKNSFGNNSSSQKSGDTSQSDWDNGKSAWNDDDQSSWDDNQTSGRDDQPFENNGGSSFRDEDMGPNYGEYSERGGGFSGHQRNFDTTTGGT